MPIETQLYRKAQRDHPEASESEIHERNMQECKLQHENKHTCLTLALRVVRSVRFLHG